MCAYAQDNLLHKIAGQLQKIKMERIGKLLFPFILIFKIFNALSFHFFNVLQKNIAFAILNKHCLVGKAAHC